MNAHKPFLCQQVRLVSDHAGGCEWIRDRFPQVESYMACLDRTHFRAECGLYAWVNDIMIGMDNDPATFGRTPGATAGMFLNGFMVEELRAAADIAHRLGLADRERFYAEKAGALEEAVRKECWDPRDGFYYSADIDVKTRAYDWFHVGLGVFWKTLPIKVRAWTGFLPLWNGMASPGEAVRLARHAEDTATFAAPGGIRSLSRDEKMYNMEPTINPSNWLGPVWIIANYLVFRGLLRYGQRAAAQRIATATLAMLADDLERTGTLHEFYNPETCAPIMNPGFLNWNMLAVVMAEEAWAP